VAHTFFDANVRYGERFGVVWWTLVIAAGGISTARLLRNRPDLRRFQQSTLLVACGVLLLGSVAMTRTLADPVHAYWNYAQMEPWRIVDALDSLPRSADVVTNIEDVVYLQTGRNTARLPTPRDYYTGEVNPRFGEQLDDIARRVRRGEAVIVVGTRGPFALDAEQIGRLTGLRQAFTSDDGVVLLP
ncbi:MAG: hypothetical protein ACKOYM_10870, partial [Actinomycetes bacterium]